jgi:hypothetical protein
MVNHHSDEITRETIYGDEEIKKVNELLGKPVTSFSLQELMNAYTKQHKLQETVSVGSNLIAAKVMQTVVEGAKFYGDKWRSIVTIDNITEEQEKVPLITESDFIVHVGPNADKKQSGGKYDEIAYDVSKENTTRSMDVPFRDRDVERKKFGVIENTIRVATRKFEKSLLDEIVEFGVANVGTSEALSSNTRFVAVSNLVAALEEAGFGEDLIAAMTPTDFAQVLQTQQGTAGPLPFITNTMLDDSGKAIRQLAAGENYMLLGFIPGIKAVNSTLAGDIMIAAKRSLRVGLYEDTKITDWKQPREKIQGFGLERTFQIKTHSTIDEGIGLVTGA